MTKSPSAVNTKGFVYSLLFSLPLMLVAAPETSVLIIRKGITKEAGKATDGPTQALIKSASGDMKVSTTDLRIEETGNILKCSGEATVFIAGRTITGRDLTVALGDGKLTVYYLSPNGVVVNPAGKKADDLTFPPGDLKADFEAWKPGEPSPFAPIPATKGTVKP